MRQTKIAHFLSIATCAALALGGVAMAKPIAPHAPLSKLGKQIMAAQHKTQPDKGPPWQLVQPRARKARAPDWTDAASVGIPAYPESLCIGVVTVTAKGMPADRLPWPRVNLVSKSPANQVQKWYADRLKGWKYDPKLKHFVRPGWTFRRMMFEPDVIVKPATKSSLALYGMAFDLSGAKTLITIAYKAKGAAK